MSEPLPSLFYQAPDSIQKPARDLAARFSKEELKALLEKFTQLRVLVVGDTIFDRYTYVRVQGLTSKNRIISGRFIKEHTDPGGALAVMRHIRQFTPHVQMVSLVGTEPWVNPSLREYLPERDDLLVRSSAFTTIIKQRYVEPVGRGKEMSKLFSVNYIDLESPAPEDIRMVLSQIETALPAVDLVVVADFGHGIMTDEVRGLVQAQAPFLALNCQTNSNNHGFNIISQRYERCDCFSLDEQEMLLACARRNIDHEKELNALRARFGSRYAWLTRGAIETIGLDDRNGQSRWPPLEPSATDTIGAGDAFFSVAALAAAAGVPIGLSTFLGQLAGAQAVKVVGNSQPISKQALLENCLSLLHPQ
jgi:bifunctional ADP-heptose synthase (sugar kinase/adenylyltransferase)